MLKKIAIILPFVSLPMFAQTATTSIMTTDRVAYVAGTPIAIQALTTLGATGNFTFKDGTTTLGSCPLAPIQAQGDYRNSPTRSGCIGTYTLSQGAHTLTAVYSGDGTYAGSTSAPVGNVVSAVQTSPQPCSAMSLGLNGALNGFIPNPNGAFRQRIDALPVDPNSGAIISDWSAAHLHLDFSSNKYGYSGIPYYVVDSSIAPGLPITVADDGEGDYPEQSDILTIWPGADPSQWIENHYAPAASDPNAGQVLSDDHLNLLDRATCLDYETYHTAFHVGQTPPMTAVASTIWDMSSRTVPQIRPVGYTSADAGGASIFDGLLRYDEAAAAAAGGPPISHATRYQTDFVMPDHYQSGSPQIAFTFPATHTANSYAGHSQKQHFGLRLRLKASFDISSYSPINQAILTSWKNYGLILTDIGSRGYVSGTPDSRWNADDLLLLQQISAASGGAFEVPQEPTIYSPDRYPAGVAATISSFTGSPASITAGGCSTLSASVANQSYSVIDGAGFFGGGSKSSTVCPTITTTYKLTTTNQFLVNDDGLQDGSRAISTFTITVSGLPCFLLCGNLLANVVHN